MNDLERLQAGFKLTPMQAQYKDAIEWYTSDAEETRGSGRTTAQAYILIERALKQPGVAVRLSADHSAGAGLLRQTAQLLPDTIRRIFRMPGMVDFVNRSDVTQELLTIFPWVCGVCGVILDDHVPHKPTAASITTMKCPFAPTSFAKGFIGRRHPDGTWHRRITLS